MSFRDWIFKLIGSGRPGAAAGPQAELTPLPGQAEAEAASYSPDDPIRGKAEDRFNRWPFAQRVAETIARREDPSSLVIGIYGVWGDGKTSTLHLMQEALRSYPHVVQVPFNPWHFESEAGLLRGFFDTLTDALNRSLPTRVERLGELLEQYGAIVTMLSGGTVSAVSEVGRALSTVKLEELKDRVEEILRDAGKRVTIFIDDIDRLDREEIQTLFKLVNLSAGFERIVYVLSFDDEMVAEALGEKYGRGGVPAGRNFLEKIVQVPLHLPPADQLSLRKLTFEGVDAAIKLAAIELTEDHVHAFGRHFVDGLEPSLSTPRQAKRYANALTFALPVLKGEVHPVDQMLIEGIRVFYPELYVAIRDNEDVVLKAGRERGGDEEKKRARQVLDAALEESKAPDKERFRTRLLEVLFPRLKSVYGNTTYGADWDERWEREQRICSEGYFQRYFRYSVPVGDVSDQAVTALIAKAGTSEPAELDAALAEFAARAAFPRLIPKLRRGEDAIEEGTANRLALAIARSGSLLPREKGMLSLDWTFMQSGILVMKLLRRMPSGPARDEAARQIIREAEPLAFAFECLQWFRKDEKETDADRFVPAAVEDALGKILASRVHTACREEPPYRKYRDDAPRLFWVWNTYGEKGEVGKYLDERLKKEPNDALELLLSYIGTAWGMESGLPHKADLRRDTYDAIEALVDPEVLLAALRSRYGSELDQPEYYHSSETPIEKRVAHQFAYVHLKVQEEKKGKVLEEKEQAPPGDVAGA